MAGRYGRKYVNDEDFDEGEVWGVMEERENSSPKLRKPFKESCLFSTSPSPRHFSATSAAPRMIPRSSVTSSEAVSSGKQQSSAPVDIPDWSKIYGKNSKKKKNGVSTSSSSSWVNYTIANDDHSDDHDAYYANGSNDQHYLNCYSNGCAHDDDDDDEDDEGIVPPHEYLARKLARSQISSFSVYEGIGRTLKGRDLSKVRNTILSKTGFLE